MNHALDVSPDCLKQRGNFYGKGHARACLTTFCCELCKNGLIDLDAVLVVDSGAPKEACIKCGACRHNLANTTELSICGGDVAFLSNYFDHLLLLLLTWAVCTVYY